MDLTMAQGQGPCTQIKLFWSYLYLAGKYCENPKVPGAQLNVNPARAIAWLVGVTIYCRFFYNSLSPTRHSPDLMQQNTFEKN